MSSIVRVLDPVFNNKDIWIIISYLRFSQLLQSISCSLSVT